jgi:hypothetical protein
VLKLLAGDVVASVKGPVQALTNVRPKSTVVSAPPRVTETPARAHSSSSSSPDRSAPAHRRAHRGVVSRPSAVTPAPVTPPAAPAPTPTALPAQSHVQGKAKALGHLRKLGLLPTPASAAAQSTEAHGPPADVPHGPPVVPPGQATNGQDTGDNNASNGRGGAR